MPPQKHEYLSSIWRDGIFDGKVIFCTGGAGTICSAQVRALVHLGANACILGRNVQKTESMAEDIATARPGAKVLGIGSVDVRSVDALQEAADRCVKELGGIDLVIAGAAGNFLAPIRSLSANAFKSVMDIDVLGSYNTVKATLPYLISSAAKHRSEGNRQAQSTGGRIIFVSATMHYNGTPLQAHVCAAKAAVDALAHAVCIEQGPLGITSNVISPGPVTGTEGTSRLFTKEQQARMKLIPAGRLGSIRDIADATVYLFSEAGSYVNGEVLVVDGGAWHNHYQPSIGDYPSFLLSSNEVSGTKETKKAKL